MTTPILTESDPGHQLRRQMRLRDLVLAQIPTVVGSSWVGVAAGVGSAGTADKIVGYITQALGFIAKL